MSWLSMKKAGCPASEGIFSSFELPSSPWQPPHCSMRSASGIFCAERARRKKKGGRKQRRPAAANVARSTAFRPHYFFFGAGLAAVFAS